MQSNIFITVPTYDKKIDLMDIYLILMTHIKYACDGEKLNFNNVRLSVPISAQKIHQNFMMACAKFVFKGIDIDFTTEPEAAFSYLMTIEQDEETFKKYKHLILMDGGDGTFDYLYVKRFNEIWSKQDGDAFNNAGTSIYKVFKARLLEVFKKPDFFKLKLINAWYDAFKKQSGTKLVDDTFELKFSDLLNYYNTAPVEK